MRWLSLGARRAAVAGSTRASSACSAGQPSGGGLGVQLGAHGGVGRRHVVQAVAASALKYSMVPPTSSGRRPRARMSPSSRVASARTRRAVGLQRVADVDQVVRHGGALGGVGLAVPMSMPR
jgi:hypothetical protein